MDLETIIVLTLAAGGMLLVAGLWRLRRLKSLTGLNLLGSGLLLLAFALVLGGVAANLYTYQRFTREQVVARLDFRRLGDQHYLARLRMVDGRSLDTEMSGDEWQLDGRILKWQGPAVWAGMDPLFRLERLSGRYRDIEQERTAPRSVDPLAPETGLNLWQMARTLGRWLPWVDAVYGSSVYLPMADDARYLVSISHNGLVARPDNDVSERAVRAWE